MTLLDTLCHEYGWSKEYALGCSLAVAFALYAATAARYGQEQQGPSYEEQAMIDGIMNRKNADQTKGQTWAA